MVTVGNIATTTSRGIGRVATRADMAPDAVVENGPAFLSVGGGVVTPTPTANAVVQADASGKVDDWVTQYNPQPSLSGIASFTAADNKIVMTGIVTALGLEIGDVIEFGGSANATNKKLRTIEAINNDNEVIVNYEHCGSRGNGSLKLSNQSSVSVTCKRIAKWYNAPIGLGQAWVEITGFRVLGTTYTNTTCRPIMVSVNSSPSLGINLFVSGLAVGSATPVGNSPNQTAGIVPPGAAYSFTGGAAGYSVRELR